MLRSLAVKEPLGKWDETDVCIYVCARLDDMICMKPHHDHCVPE